MTFQSERQWRRSCAALISIPSHAGAPGSEVAGRQASRQAGRIVWQHAKSSTAVHFPEDHNPPLFPLQSSSEPWRSLTLWYAGCCCWLTHCIQWPQKDCDEWWASQLTGPFFHLSYFLCRWRNRICEGRGKKRHKWKVRQGEGEKQYYVAQALKSTFFMLQLLSEKQDMIATWEGRWFSPKKKWSSSFDVRTQSE